MTFIRENQGNFIQVIEQNNSDHRQTGRSYKVLVLSMSRITVKQQKQSDTSLLKEVCVYSSTHTSTRH